MELTERTKNLIAVSASIAANCDPCLRYHLDEARKGGISGEEIAETIEIAKTVQKKATSGIDKLVSRLASFETLSDGDDYPTVC